MFNPADFDALTAALEERYAQRRNTPDMEAERAMLLYAVSTARHLAESFDMIAPEPAPVRLCQECHAAPAIRLSRLCEACYAIACEEIRAELAQEQTADKALLCNRCGLAPALPRSGLCKTCIDRLGGFAVKGEATSGVDKIAAERATHEARGYTAARDDQWESSELAKAAICYASPFIAAMYGLWPWDNEAPLPVFNVERRIEQLAKAGALIAAEIDRLERFAESQQARDDEQVRD